VQQYYTVLRTRNFTPSGNFLLLLPSLWLSLWVWGILLSLLYPLMLGRRPTGVRPYFLDAYVTYVKYVPVSILFYYIKYKYSKVIQSTYKYSDT
jgi:hypothetical protein